MAASVRFHSSRKRPPDLPSVAEWDHLTERDLSGPIQEPLRRDAHFSVVRGDWAGAIRDQRLFSFEGQMHSLHSLISVMTIAYVPFRSNEIPFTCTYSPTKGINFFSDCNRAFCQKLADTTRHPS